MHRSPARLRVVAPLALASLVLGMPAAAVAETAPAPSATTSASSTATTTPSAATSTPSATPSTSSSSSSAAPSAAAGLPAAPGTTWDAGACAADVEGVTAVLDLQGSDPAVARCVTSTTGGSAYSSTNSLQTFADAGWDVLTKSTSFGPQICQVDGAPSTNPCDAWTGVWWSFWTGTDAGWKQAETGAHETPAPTGTFVALSLVDNVNDAPAPRVPTTTPTSTPSSTPTPTATTPGPTPTAPAGPGRADLASQWLLSRSVQPDGTYDLQSGGINPGLMIDMLLALVAEDPSNPKISGVWASIAKQIPEWVDFEWEGTHYVDGPSAAKAMLAAESVRGDVHDVAGLDVAKTLQSKINDKGQVLDLGDGPAYGFGQTLAVLALARADLLETPVLDAMLTQQCPSGGFRLGHGAKPCADATDSVGVDATAMGLQAMLAAERSGVDVPDSNVTRAVGYLTDTATSGGGWPNDGFTTTVNSNSTGLAVQALGAYLAEHPGSATAESAVTKGRAWVAGLQVLPATNAAVSNVGAIAYSTEAFTTGPATGTDQWERATPQAMLAFGLPGFDTLVTAAAPTTPGTPTPTATAPGTGTPSGSTNPSATTGTPGAGGNGDNGAGSGSGSDDAAGDPGQGLAYTGAAIWPALAVATLLLLLGGGFVLVSRRRGVHA
ncbi:hypothetical protein [Knoellia sp. LjRoot47]|uniref:hypothetical protein n=1 Tax=Knoellia sp. LjRoot47 TaxID=3342330 RepID=UPI003ECFF81B